MKPLSIFLFFIFIATIPSSGYAQKFFLMPLTGLSNKENNNYFIYDSKSEIN